MGFLLLILILLAVINGYIFIRARQKFDPSRKFGISMISLLLIFVFYKTIAFFFADSFMKGEPSVFYLTFTIAMNILLPVLITELVMIGYSRLGRK